MNSKNTDQNPKTPMTSLIVNLAYINEYLEGEKEPTIQVISIFLKQATNMITKLEQGIEAKNYHEITYAAHFLSSSFTTMGINCVEEINLVESLSRQNESLYTISKLLHEMMPKYLKSIKEYRRILKNLQSS